MSVQFKRKTQQLQNKMADLDIDVALIQDADNIYYLSAFWGYLDMRFGRPTFMFVPSNDSCAIITPGLEAEMARKMTWVDSVQEWTDGVDGEWRRCLQNNIDPYGPKIIGIERGKTHPLVIEFLEETYPDSRLKDISGILSEMRMIKSREEIQLMREAGEISMAMCQGGKDAIREGVAEYEIALAVINSGTRKAADLLDGTDELDTLYSPLIHNLQIMQSGGADLSMVHRRPTKRKVQWGESVYMCFCEMNNYKGIKLGFDRQYWVGDVPDEEARMYEITLEAQSAALRGIRPGAIAEDVHNAAAEVYQREGYGSCYRTGRSVGFSLIEKPELKTGDRTELRPGMTFAVDGAVSIERQAATRVGDSILVTDDGFDFLTPFPRELEVV